ncbi:MAG: hypothetical protein FD187_159 [bacterium]|nr:MAG: hypothetical protein FD142_1376 [bacterium]KAF0150727.1 MAG: hypothetical protein FD187_159 [bacterium]KAF0169580.1 MAG: hypothetical protein FD158_413 [bacterium]TXT22508.1 MAG: hypothetical protein FD132_463 [bacterium]
MNFSPDQRFFALLALNGGRIQTWKWLTELEALRKARSYFPDHIPETARLVLRPVGHRGILQDGFVEYHRSGNRWKRANQPALDTKAA